MIILIISIDQCVFFNFSQSDDNLGNNFASLLSRKIKYLFTYLLVTVVFSAKIYFLIVCVEGRGMRIHVDTENYPAHHAFQILSSIQRLGSQIQQCEDSLDWRASLCLEDSDSQMHSY